MNSSTGGAVILKKQGSIIMNHIENLFNAYRQAGTFQTQIKQLKEYKINSSLGLKCQTPPPFKFNLITYFKMHY